MLRYWGPLDFSQSKVEHVKKRREASIEATLIFLHLYQKVEQTPPKSNKQIENNLPKI